MCEHDAKPRCLFTYDAACGSPVTFEHHSNNFGCSEICTVATQCAAGAFIAHRIVDREKWACFRSANPFDFSRIEAPPLPPSLLQLTSHDEEAARRFEMIGFDKAINEMCSDEIRQALIMLRSERKARAVVRRETRRKRTSESSELDVMLRMLPKEAQEELAAMMSKYTGEGGEAT